MDLAKFLTEWSTIVPFALALRLLGQVSARYKATRAHAEAR